MAKSEINENVLQKKRMTLNIVPARRAARKQEMYSRQSEYSHYKEAEPWPKDAHSNAHASVCACGFADSCF